MQIPIPAVKFGFLPKTGFKILKRPGVKFIYSSDRICVNKE
jgi:hypothetical protein